MRAKQRENKELRPLFSDGESLVILVEPTDYEKMVHAYFALRVWVLQEDVSIK